MNEDTRQVQQDHLTREFAKIPRMIARLPADCPSTAQEIEQAATDLQARMASEVWLTLPALVQELRARGFSHVQTYGEAIPLAAWDPYGLRRDARPGVSGQGWYGVLSATAPNEVRDAALTLEVGKHGVPTFQPYGIWRMLTPRELCANCEAVLHPESLWQVRGLEATLGPFCSAPCAQRGQERAAAARGGSGRPAGIYQEPTATTEQAAAGLGPRPAPAG